MKLVGRYQIKSRIGQGAMANVYRAYDPEIQRELAIKVLNQQFRKDPECVSRFLQEARAAGSLSHPNIVTIYDVGEAQGFPYIAMELLNGQPLDVVMRERGAFDPADVLNIGVQLSDALAYAHQLGIVHRDIKPSNVMLSQDGRTPKILDFGIARVSQATADADATRLMHTQVGQVIGTPRYMSPEQALGRTLDGRSDQFSLGVVLYEMVAGKPAFDGASIATVALQITSQPHQPISVIPECPRGLRFIIDKMLAKLPEKRFADCGQAADALRRETSGWTTATTEAKARSLPLHLRFMLLATGCVALVLGLGISLALDHQYRAMERVALTSGSSITSFVASNVALHMVENAAREADEADWLPVEAFVRTASADKNITQMLIADRKGVIRAAANPSQIGKMYASGRREAVDSDLGVAYASIREADGVEAFHFSRPILYAGREVGQVEIGVRKNDLMEAANLARMMLVALGAIMMAVVIGLSFLGGRLVLAPVRRLNAALKDAAGGNLDFRLTHGRRDEFGELFDSFNALAAKFQNEAPAPASPAHAPPAGVIMAPSLLATVVRA